MRKLGPASVDVILAKITAAAMTNSVKGSYRAHGLKLDTHIDGSTSPSLTQGLYDIANKGRPIEPAQCMYIIAREPLRAQRR
jgi:hypothetical protein